ncbi:MAG TPA: hypothetical protein VIH11_03770 [Gemmatimonadaceae bacterium]
MTESHARRLREMRSRMLVRAFDHRQRRHARGVWFRLRRVLAFASEAYALPRDEAERLIAEGHQPESVGEELAPPRLILFVPRARVARIASARPLALRLNAEMLSAECLALVSFPTETNAAR